MSDVNTVRGDYDQKQMLQKFQEGTVITGVVQNYLRNANGKKAIVFNINVEHSKTMNRLFSMKLELLLLTWMERQIKPLDKR
jgi:hypothetical protein